MDFGGTKVALAVCDLEGRRLAELTMPTEPSRGARFNLDRALEAARSLVKQVGALSDLDAVGACTFGIPRADEVQLAVAIPGWNDLALGSEISRALGCEVVALATDVKAAAAAEARSGALKDADPAIYLNLGTGLAVGIITAGDVVVGANGAAGEIGYNIRSFADLEREPDERVLLEQVVSGMALRDTAGSGVSAADVFAGAGENAVFAAALGDFIGELSFHLVNLCVALNPERVAVGGGMVRSWSMIEPKLRHALETSVPFPPELVLGAFPFDAPLVGAITIGIEAARGWSSLSNSAVAYSEHDGAGRPTWRSRPVGTNRPVANENGTSSSRGHRR